MKSMKASEKNHKWYKNIYEIIKEFIDNINKDDVGVYAAQSTFYIVLSAVPLAMLIVLCLKYFVSVDLATVITSIEKALPQAIAQFLSSIVSEVFYRTETTAVFSAAFITLLWTSSKGTMAVYCGLNKIYGYTKELGWMRMRIMSFFYNILFIAVIISSVVVIVFGNAILSFFDEKFILAHYIIRFIMQFRFIIFFVLFMLGFAALFTFLPQRKNKYRFQLWGAAVTAVGWLVISYGFSLYIQYFPRFSYIYGSLTAIMLLMLWLFFCIYILLVGAEINKHIENGYFWRFKLRILRHYIKNKNKENKD